MNQYYVYIMSNNFQSVFYTGVTNDLIRRVYEHRNKLVQGFTSKYKIVKLLYYEQSQDVKSAIAREKQVKDYRRTKKIDLIKEFNPSFKDLYNEIIK